MSTSSINDLERRAVEERGRLHKRANEIETEVRIVRQNLDPNLQARRHFGPAALVLAGVGLLSGYIFGGMFTRH